MRIGPLLNPPQTDPSFASGEIGLMAYGAMGIGPLENLPQTHPSFASGEIGLMAYGAMGIRTPDLLNAIVSISLFFPKYFFLVFRC
jgi:hypothetical protein